MRAQGRLTEWNDDRGFGFIEPLDGGPRVFVHVSEFPRDKRRPRALDLVGYTPGRDERSRLHATGVEFLTLTASRQAVRSPRSKRSDLALPLVVVTGFTVVLVLLIVFSGYTPAVLLLYGFLSLIAFLAYGSDKVAAQRDTERTSEATLHLLAFLGGWPGALIAQRVYHHKTRKPSFQLVFWLMVALNCLLLLAFTTLDTGVPG